MLQEYGAVEEGEGKQGGLESYSSHTAITCCACHMVDAIQKRNATWANRPVQDQSRLPDLLIHAGKVSALARDYTKVHRSPFLL